MKKRNEFKVYAGTDVRLAAVETDVEFCKKNIQAMSAVLQGLLNVLGNEKEVLERVRDDLAKELMNQPELLSQFPAEQPE